ncbi:MAG: DUF1844 domain-containing protein, partial [Candidatus Aminicenantaceae bacterium]
MTEKNKKKEGPKATGKKAKEKKEEKQEEKQEDKSEEKRRDETEPKKILPPLDFSSLVLPFFTQALIELGETENPEAKNTEENLKLTQRLIDML